MIQVKKLDKATFEKAERFLLSSTRPLEKAIYECHFKNGDKNAVLNELLKYQNEDGGFGHGLESDFRLPYSSPMATSIGLRILSELDDMIEAHQMIKSSIQYLKSSFDKDRKGWYAVPKEVNMYPHAAWWHYDEEKEMSIIDQSWGNPSAEIIAYFYKYREYAAGLDAEFLVETAIDYVKKKATFQSEHEIYCFLKLYKVLPENFRSEIREKLRAAIAQVIVKDKSKWDKYVPRPIDFVKSPEDPKFGIPETSISENLEYVVEQLESNGVILPPWGKSYYQENLLAAYDEWTGVLTLEALTVLDNFGVIERS